MKSARNEPRKAPKWPRCIGKCGLRAGFTMTFDTADGRPRFKCSNCGGTWTAGRSGGIFREAVEAELSRAAKRGIAP